MLMFIYTPYKVRIDSRNGLAPNGDKLFLESMLAKTWTRSKMLGSLVSQVYFVNVYLYVGPAAPSRLLDFQAGTIFLIWAI